MFFCISGFVVLLSAWGRRPHEFVISRIVRLYPAYWVAVTITAIVAITLSHGLFKVTPVRYAANLTMLNSLPRIVSQRYHQILYPSVIVAVMTGIFVVMTLIAQAGAAAQAGPGTASPALLVHRLRTGTGHALHDPAGDPAGSCAGRRSLLRVRAGGSQLLTGLPIDVLRK